MKKTIKSDTIKNTEKSLKISASFRKEVDSLLKYPKKPTGEAYKKANEIISQYIQGNNKNDFEYKALFLMSCALSMSTLPGYSTLNIKHIDEISNIIKLINLYVEDHSKQRPLNFIMLASPGSGKSHFVKCIAKKIGINKSESITYNMSGLQDYNDIIPAMDMARNLKIEDKMPILFLDEFDSKEDNYSFLLPLLWDGELTIGQHNLKLGKSVIFMAGSNPTINLTMDEARSMRIEEKSSDKKKDKLVDLLSRINGGIIKIPSLNDSNQIDQRKIEKIVITISLIRQKYNNTVKRIPNALLKFITNTNFRYGIRSITQIIDMLPYKEDSEEIKLSEINLPLGSAKAIKESIFAYHFIHEEQENGVAENWKKYSEDESLITIFSDNVDFLFNRRVNTSFFIEIMLEKLYTEIQ